MQHRSSGTASDEVGRVPGVRRSMRGFSAVGLVISLVSLAGVVWWISKQDQPALPDSPEQLAALGGAIAVYALATALRAERWQALMASAGVAPARRDSYALTLVGYMGNNVLPARGGDAMRVYLMAPRAGASYRTVVGTLVAERALDVATLAALFVGLAYGVLRGVERPSLTWLWLLAAAFTLILVVVLIGRAGQFQRVRELAAPLATATLALRGRHGARMGALTAITWGLEGLTYLLVALSVALEISYVEALYVIAVAGVFVLVPSGPGYVGTLDAAVLFAAGAIGAAGSLAVSFLLMLRLVLLVPITVAGLVALVWRYGGFSLRGPSSEAERR